MLENTQNPVLEKIFKIIKYWENFVKDSNKINEKFVINLSLPNVREYNMEEIIVYVVNSDILL